MRIRCHPISSQNYARDTTEQCTAVSVQNFTQLEQARPLYAHTYRVMSNEVAKFVFLILLNVHGYILYFHFNFQSGDTKKVKAYSRKQGGEEVDDWRKHFLALSKSRLRHFCPKDVDSNSLRLHLHGRTNGLREK